MSADDDSWNLHWQHEGNVSALATEWSLQKQLDSFWKEHFAGELTMNRPRNVLDVACGSGVVLAGIAEEAQRLQHDELLLYGLDASSNGLKQLVKRIPGALPCVADIRKLPYPSGSFELVTSQFGAEYGGWSALIEAARMVKAGGSLALISHLKNSALQAECETNLAAVTRITSSGLFPAAKIIFSWAGPRAPYARTSSDFQVADQQLGAAVRMLEENFRRLGQGIAGGNLWRLYSDLAHMYPRLANYDPGEAAAWVQRMERELHAYGERMRLMIAAALGPDTWSQFMTYLEANAFRVELNQTMQSQAAAPVAWTLVARRLPAPCPV